MTAKKPQQVILLIATLMSIGEAANAQISTTEVEGYDLSTYTDNFEMPHQAPIALTYTTREREIPPQMPNVEKDRHLDVYSPLTFKQETKEVHLLLDPSEKTQSGNKNLSTSFKSRSGNRARNPPEELTSDVMGSIKNDTYHNLSFFQNKPIGGIDIVIQDEIFSTVAFEEEIPCNCGNYSITQELESSWPSLESVNSFDLIIVNESSPVCFNTIHGEVLTNEIQFNISCSGQFLPELENDTLFFYQDTVYKGFFTFDPSYYFIDGQSVLISFCDEEGARKRYEDNNTDQTQPVIFPNPAQDFLIVRNANSTSKEVAMKIFNASGIEQKNQQMEMNDLSGECLVHLDGLSPGWYFLTIQKEGANQSYPFLKQ
ncbi:MAG: T9SS type A sorting domain-containing protein [Saprospiraceae bacterium]|nr:T9SS type A sorting domain-containing protein [Saprospiraceae bacterium]